MFPLRRGRSATPLLCVLFLAGCSTSVYREVYPTLTDGHYDSEFPYRGCSKQLEEISETVNMLNSIAYYRSTSFSLEERVTRPQIAEAMERHRTRQSVYTNSTASGTATIIWYGDRHVALLTCAHIVDFEDTVFSFHITPDHKPSPFVNSVAIKEKQTNYVAVLPEGGELEILAIDKSVDIAIMGRRFSVEPPGRIPVFRYPLGNAKDLEWGTFVYLFGYPSGLKMVTKGIVSSPNKDRRGTFLVDAMFSRGFSGGIALAIRDGVPNFELVGLIKLVSAHTSYVLIPEMENNESVFDPSSPYTGAAYVERKTEIESGITQAVPVEAIREFLSSRVSELEAKGYSLGKILKPE